MDHWCSQVGPRQPAYSPRVPTKKMPRGLVALSSSAIATIYFAGFVATRSADAGLAAAAAAGATAPAVESSASPPASSPTAVTPVISAGSAGTAAYQDGTYTGQGTSRRGGVSVSVTIQSGRIQNVTITASNTEYPVSRIASLPAQVVSRQSAQINAITGATYSSQAFQQAVQQALAKAV